MLARIGLISTVLLLALGCGGPGSFNGEVAGNKLTVNEAVFIASRDYRGVVGSVFLIMADVTTICADISANWLRKNATYVYMDFHRTQGTGTDTVVVSPDKGTYTVLDTAAPAPSDSVFTEFYKTQANCTIDLPQYFGKSGTVTIYSIEFETGGTLTGEFDINYGTQNDHVTGTFNASLCQPSYPSGSPSCG